MLAKWVRRSANLAITTTACVVWLSADALASADQELPLTLTVYDYAQVPRDVRVEAAKTVAQIYGALGVEMVWVEWCVRAACRTDTQQAAVLDTRRPMLSVHIVGNAMPPFTHKTRIMGVAPTGGYMAYAFFDRIRAFAMRRELYLSTVLGHVIAHEVGHLLLRDGHAESGIMRASWSGADLLEAQRGRLGFTPVQGHRIRAQVAEMRSDGAEEVEVFAASALWHP
jgi:hypothetical protein